MRGKELPTRRVRGKTLTLLAVSGGMALLLAVVGLQLEIGWLPPLITQSRNPSVQPGAAGYLDASLAATILEIPNGNITRAMGDVHPLGNPHYYADPKNLESGNPAIASAAEARLYLAHPLLGARLIEHAPIPLTIIATAGVVTWSGAASTCRC